LRGWWTRYTTRLFTGKRKTGQIGPPLLASALVYVVLSVLMTWPLALRLNTHVPTPDGDVFNVYWGNWWVRHALGNGQNPYFSDYLIYPEGFNLVSFAFSPFLALLWIPLSWILPPLAAYNLVLLATIVLCCIAMDQLIRYLTGNAWAAMVAGITFGFAPILVAERLPHLNLAALFWIPWAMLLLIRLMREVRIRDAILLGVVVACAFLTRLQVGVLAVMFTGVCFVGLAFLELKSWHRLAPGRLVLAGLVFLLLSSPLWVYAWQSLQQAGIAGLTREGAEGFQTDLLAYVLPVPQNPLLGSWTSNIYNQRFAVNAQYWAYVGLVPLLLVLYAAVSSLRKALPWLLTGLFFFVLALGPVPRVNGQTYPGVPLPYSWATDLFSAIGFNWPNRFNLALMPAASVLVGIACAHIFARFRSAWPLGVVTLLTLGEYLVVPLPTIFPPPHSAFYDQMAADQEAYAVVDLPLTRADGEIHRYFQTIHHKPIVGGWDHRVPSSAFAFMAANPLLAQWLIEDRSGVPFSLDKTLAQLSEANVRYIVIHKDRLKSVPEGVRALLGILRPAFQDWSILVLPTSASSAKLNLVRWFGEGLGLVQPITFLHLSWDGRPPLLSLYLCWLRGGQGDVADAYRLTLTAPDGSVTYDETFLLPGVSQGLACDTPQLVPLSPLQAGEHQLSVTPLSGERALGTYTTTQPIYLAQTRDGTLFPTMGFSSPVDFQDSMELTGYNMMGGDGFVWTDLFLRSSSRHTGSYLLSAQFLDPGTGQVVSRLDDTIPNRKWKREDLYQQRQILWLDNTAPGRYSLRVVLEGPPAPTQYREPSPGEVAALEVPLVVLPVGMQGSVTAPDRVFVAFTHAGG
jgi:hypothetical protein